VEQAEVDQLFNSFCGSRGQQDGLQRICGTTNPTTPRVRVSLREQERA